MRKVGDFEKFSHCAMIEGMKIIRRKEYLDTLFKLKDVDLIKVVTGVRRAGKSKLLDCFREELAREVAGSRIFKYDFEKPECCYDRSWKEIYDEINGKLVGGRKNYVFLDEVQNVDGFERLLDGLYANKNVDLYVTGSNAYLLSSELSTLLTGRAFNVNVLPFSFREFCETYTDFREKNEMFLEYLKYSALPQAGMLLHADPNLVAPYVREVYNSILENDIKKRHMFGSERAFGNIVEFMLDNVGNMVSPNKIARVLTAEGKAIDSRTVERYLDYLVESYVLYKVERYDIRGRQHLVTQAKYYLSDLGFRNALIGKELGGDMGHLLENVVYLELVRRGGQVWIGKAGEREVDFVMKDKGGWTTYYQVAWSVRNEETLKRELASFDKIRDHSLKILLTMDPEEGSRNGVRQQNVVEFLLGERVEGLA